MVTAISDSRIVPVAEDLTTEELGLSIIRGLETMKRVDKKFADGVEFLAGEWAVLQDDQTCVRASASPVPNTYLVFLGTDRFDSHATGQITLLMNSIVMAKTTRYDKNPSYSTGDYLTVKDLGGGESMLTLQSSAEPKLAKVIEVADGVMTFETLLG